jgi:cation-transporting ATPase E
VLSEALKSTGLTSAEAAERRRRGLVNRTPRSDWRAYLNILSRNLFTWFNAMVTPAAIALFALQEYQGGIAVSGMAIVNSALGLVQEIRAKHHLDKLALLVETRARVLRDGQVQEIHSGDVVQEDVILLSAGETVVADGPVVEASFLEIDEALLTGESDPVRRQPGDMLLSGSFCVAGEGCYRADRVGLAAFANHTSVEARAYHYAASPLTRVVNRLIQILSLTAIALCLLYTAAFLVEGFPGDIDHERRYVRMVAATITSMVPQGLVLTATLSFTLGAVYMSRRGAVVQRLAAVETMASIDVICTDKTGTLTTNQLRLDRLHPLSRRLPEEEIRLRLQQFASASLDRKNKSVLALKAGLGETQVELLDQLPFKSQNRYSAVRIRAEDSEHILVLGACEALAKHLEPGANDWEALWGELLPTGLRLLLFAAASRPAAGFAPFTGTLEGFQLQPLCLVALSDELRPEAGAVLEALAAQGIAFKVISGDNPETVHATVAQLRLALAQAPVVSGDELASAAERKTLIEERSVFGRVAPLQKVEIVRTLQEAGHRVAMIGDGVNDVLPIKRADLGIAMGEGSQASKTVAGLVLESNNFALLPETLEEGRTIVRNLRRSSKLFLVKNVYSFLLILACFTGVFGLGFPYLPQQVTLLNWLVIGVPAFVIAVSRERSTAATRPRFLREVGWFALRTGIIFALCGVVLLALSRWFWPDIDEHWQRTLLLSMLVLLGLSALFRALSDGEERPLLGDNRFRLLGVLAMPAYAVAMYWRPAARFFDLAPLGPGHWGLVLAVTAAGLGLSLLSDAMGTTREDAGKSETTM